MYYKNGDKYEGEWKNDEREGNGKMIYKNGSIEEGEYKNNQFQKKGLFFFW